MIPTYRRARAIPWSPNFTERLHSGEVPDYLLDTKEDIAAIIASIKANSTHFPVSSTTEYLSMVQSYKCMLSHFPHLKTVFYPCSWADITPSKGFEWCRVVYCDTNQNAIDRLTEAWYEWYCEDAYDLEVENPDLILFLNAHISPDKFSPRLWTGGLIVSNGYTQGMRCLFGAQDLEYLGYIDLAAEKVCLNHWHTPLKNSMANDDNIFYIFRKR